MKVTTKALTSLLIVAMLTVSSTTGVAAMGNSRTATHSGDKKLARLIKRHDRKMELRASVLGMSADELKDQLKDKTFYQIIRSHGFRSVAAFQTALSGKLKDELHRRGWSDDKINNLLTKRLERLAKNER